MKPKPGQTIVYRDELTDDFFETRTNRTVSVDGNYRYLPKNPFFRFFSFLAYYCLALPLLWLYGKLILRVRVEGRKNVRKLKKTGYVVYCNHTNWWDSFIGAVFVARPKQDGDLHPRHPHARAHAGLYSRAGYHAGVYEFQRRGKAPDEGEKGARGLPGSAYLALLYRNPPVFGGQLSICGRGRRPRPPGRGHLPRAEKGRKTREKTPSHHSHRRAGLSRSHGRQKMRGGKAARAGIRLYGDKGRFARQLRVLPVRQAGRGLTAGGV